MNNHAIIDVIDNKFNNLLFGDGYDQSMSRNMAIDRFDTGFMGVKIFGLLFMLIAAIVNRDTNFGAEADITQTKNMIKFVIETIVFGIAGALPFVYMEYMRNPNHTDESLVNIFTLGFLFMAGINVLLQFSGFYTMTFGELEDHNIITHPMKMLNGLKHTFIGTTGLMILGIIIYLIVCAFLVRDFDIPAYQTSGNSFEFIAKFVLELVIFAAGSSIPYLLAAHNRTNHINKHAYFETGLLFGKFAALHMILQASGFYGHIFKS
jgi:hypothetical protein